MNFVERSYYKHRIQQRYSKEEIKSLLTDRQIEVLELAAKGFSDLEISERLGTSSHTIVSHFKNRKRPVGIFARLNAYSRREAVVKAIALDLLNPKKAVTNEEIERCKLLSEHEIEVLELLTSPFLSSLRSTNIEIAERIGNITHWTVKYYLSSIFKKLEIKTARGPRLKSTRAAVIFLAYQQSFTSPS